MSTKVFDASSPAAGGEATSAHPQATRGDRCKRPRTARFLIRQAFESLLRWDKSDVLNKERAGLQKGNGDSDLIPERRRLVVCGTTVTNARSRSPTPVLATKAGRTFLRHAKIEQPHSPPSGAILLYVQKPEHIVSRARGLFILQGAGIERDRAAKKLRREYPLLVGRQRVEGLQQFACMPAHVARLTASDDLDK